VQLVITLSPDGNVNVQGPIENKLLCYGLLEAAKDAIRNFDPARKPGLLLPRMGVEVPKANGPH
jgi:hypothetical protein